jgi:hypothetical protein
MSFFKFKVGLISNLYGHVLLVALMPSKLDKSGDTQGAFACPVEGSKELHASPKQYLSTLRKEKERQDRGSSTTTFRTAPSPGEMNNGTIRIMQLNPDGSRLAHAGSRTYHGIDVTRTRRFVCQHRIIVSRTVSDGDRPKQCVSDLNPIISLLEEPQSYRMTQNLPSKGHLQ